MTTAEYPPARGIRDSHRRHSILASRSARRHQPLQLKLLQGAATALAALRSRRA
jgi:hypothetical protein